MDQIGTAKYICLDNNIMLQDISSYNIYYHLNNKTFTCNFFGAHKCLKYILFGKIDNEKIQWENHAINYFNNYNKFFKDKIEKDINKLITLIGFI